MLELLYIHTHTIWIKLWAWNFKNECKSLIDDFWNLKIKGVTKKLKKQLHRENQKNNNWKNWTVKKTDYNFEKTDRFVFGFISMKPKKPNQTQNEKNRAKLETNRANQKNRAKQKKPSQNQKNKLNRIKPSQNKKKASQTRNFVLKTRTEPKPIGLNMFRFGFSCFFKKKFSLIVFF